MDGIQLLKRDALIRRNAKIFAAKREYYRELKAIKALQGKLGIGGIGRPRKVVVTEDPTLKATTVARDILLEGKAMTIMELTIEAQRRGCRSADEPRVVAHAIRSGLNHYRRHFKRDEAGRWGVVRTDEQIVITLIAVILSVISVASVCDYNFSRANPYGCLICAPIKGTIVIADAKNRSNR